jgi:hypothetical protein
LWVTPPEGQQLALGLFWLAGVLSLLLHAYTTLTLIEPGERHPMWDKLARERGWTTETRGETWWRATAPGPRELTVTVELDPAPARTRFVQRVSELRDISVSKRQPGTPAGLSLADPVLDSFLHVQGDPELARNVLPRARELWLQLVHGWNATLHDGILTLELEGAEPKDDLLQQVLEALRELEVAGSQAEATRAPPRMPQTVRVPG